MPQELKNPVMCTVTPGPHSQEDVGSQAATLVLKNKGPGGVAQHHAIIFQVRSVEGNPVRVTLRDGGELFVSISITPHNVEFKHPVTIRLSYAGCTVADPTKLKVCRRENPGGEWHEVPVKEINTDEKWVTVERKSFSQYALGAG